MHLKNDFIKSNQENEKMKLEDVTLDSFTILNQDSNSDSIYRLNQILSDIGVTFGMSDTQHGLGILYISIDKEKLNKFKTRNAGRGQSDEYKEKIIKCKYTVGDIKKMKKNMKHDEIIEMLGISRSSYYRAWREAKDVDNKRPFLYFK